MQGTRKKYLNIHSHNRQNDDEEVILNFSPFNAFARRESMTGLFSAGIHPWDAGKQDEDRKNLEILTGLVSHPLLFAIGESGLDRVAGPSPEYQEELFRLQAGIAMNAGKPVIIHCVRSYPEIIRIRKEFAGSPPWIIHGFTGNLQAMDELVRHGFFISFGKEVLDPHPKLVRVAEKVPAERLFLETDDSAHRVEDIFKAVACIRGVDPDILALQVWKNFDELGGGITGIPQLIN